MTDPTYEKTGSEFKELSRDFTPSFKEKYGQNVSIKRIRLSDGCRQGLEYKISIEYRKSNKKRKTTVDVFVLMGSSAPFIIDGEITEAGKRHISYWEDYGKMIGGAY